MKITPTDYKTQVKIFELAGCKYVRTHGDHLIYHHSNAIRPVVIPKYNEIPVFVIKSNMKAQRAEGRAQRAESRAQRAERRGRGAEGGARRA